MMPSVRRTVNHLRAPSSRSFLRPTPTLVTWHTPRVPICLLPARPRPHVSTGSDSTSWPWMVAAGVAGALWWAQRGHLHAEETSMEKLLELVKDPSTWLEVPRFLHLHGMRFQMLGIGARQVTFLRINVYTVAVYAPELSAATDLATFVQKTTPVLLYITPTRPAELSHLRDGFIKHLKHRHIDAQLIQTFSSMFPKRRILKGQALILEKHANGLTVYLDGDNLGEITSPVLATALFDAYLTDPPVSPKMLHNLKENFASL